MPNLAADAAVSGADGDWKATLTPDWTVWSINGGYLATIMLGACAAHSVFDRPASVSCHFIAQPKPGPVRLRTEQLRRTRSAESLSVQLTQNDELIASGLVWMVAAPLDGLTHDTAVPPLVPPPRQLRSTDEMLTEKQRQNRPPIWRNFEQRPINWPDDWRDPTPTREPRALTWLRFTDTEGLDDPVIDAGRLLILLDLYPPTAAYWFYDNENRTHHTVSLDLNVTLHRGGAHSPWVLIDAEAPLGGDGLVAGRATAWSQSGQLLATSTQQLLCRRAR